MILQLPHTDTTGLSLEDTMSRFTQIFRTKDEGPINDLVLQEEQVRQLAMEMVQHSPELASLLASTSQ